VLHPNKNERRPVVAKELLHDFKRQLDHARFATANFVARPVPNVHYYPHAQLRQANGSS
jgi:hypothetical protein